MVAAGDHQHPPDRHDNIREQVLVYKRRCELMNYACLTGFVSAMFFLPTLVARELDSPFPNIALLSVSTR